MPPKKKLRPVIVCTARRYVAYGYTDAEGAPEVIQLQRARCAIYWGTTGGVHQLAATGPVKGKSRIGSVAPAVTLREVTAVIDCSPEAAAAWDGWS